MHKAVRPALLLAATMTLSACEDPPPVYVDQAVIQLSPNPKTPSAGYFTVHAGNAPVVLRDVMTDAAVRVEMHESVTRNGVASMAEVDSVAIPAKATVRFAPGGRHLMLWNVNPAIAATGKVEMTFLFSNGDRILVDAAVRRMGDGDGMAGMDHHH